MNERETGMEKHKPEEVCSRHAHRHMQIFREKKKFSSEISTGVYNIFLIEVEVLTCLAFCFNITEIFFYIIVHY